MFFFLNVCQSIDHQLTINSSIIDHWNLNLVLLQFLSCFSKDMFKISYQTRRSKIDNAFGTKTSEHCSRAFVTTLSPVFVTQLLNVSRRTPRVRFLTHSHCILTHFRILIFSWLTVCLFPPPNTKEKKF